MKNQVVTIVDSIFGSIDVVVKINPYYEDTLEIANKRCCFTEVLPEDFDMNKENFHIILYGDARKIRTEIIVRDKTIYAEAWHNGSKHEEILFK